MFLYFLKRFYFLADTSKDRDKDVKLRLNKTMYRHVLKIFKLIWKQENFETLLYFPPELRDGTMKIFITSISWMV